MPSSLQRGKTSRLLDAVQLFRVSFSFQKLLVVQGTNCHREASSRSQALDVSKITPRIPYPDTYANIHVRYTIDIMKSHTLRSVARLISLTKSGKDPDHPRDDLVLIQTSSFFYF
jgi:hypothetical protein